MTMTEDVCAICGNDYDWHEMNQPRHKFARKGDPGALAQLDRKKREKERPQRLLPGLPTDPALRVLLMRKGIITPDELSETEDEIRRTREEGGIVIVSSADARVSSSQPDPGLGNGTGT